MSEAQILASRLLEDGPTPGPSAPVAMLHLPCKIQRADGTLIQGEFNGYYDMRQFGRGVVAAVGYANGEGAMTSGFLAPGEKITTHVPTFERWQQWVASKQRPQQQPAQAT